MGLTRRGPTESWVIQCLRFFFSLHFWNETVTLSLACWRHRGQNQLCEWMEVLLRNARGQQTPQQLLLILQVPGVTVAQQ